jgi:hypothetical protein
MNGREISGKVRILFSSGFAVTGPFCECDVIYSFDWRV